MTLRRPRQRRAHRVGGFHFENGRYAPMSTVMIMDPLAERGGDLRRILEFLEYETVVVSDPGDWQAAFSEGHAIEVVLMAPCTGDDGLLEAYRALRDYDPALPIIYLRDPHSDSASGREIDADTIATITLPVRQPDLQFALQQALIQGDGREHSGAPRSPEIGRAHV